MSEADAIKFIEEKMTRDPNPDNEVETAVAKAYDTTLSNSGSGTKTKGCHPIKPKPVPLSKIKYDESKLRAVADKIQRPHNWRHWLWERSPKRPEPQNALSFLKHLFRPGEIVLAFDRFKARRPAWSFTINNPMDCRVPEQMREGGHEGVWYLCNPVDGLWHPNLRLQDKRLSCRSQESVIDFRYAVLESDIAPMDLWLGFIAQLPLKIAAIYTSGSRSVHTLFRVDAKTKDEWDAVIEPRKRPLRVLGGDAGSLSAVRLTRLPGCRRPDKNGFQRLLYLAPDPPLCRLIDLPVLRARQSELARWRLICPRWNSNLEGEA